MVKKRVGVGFESRKRAISWDKETRKKIGEKAFLQLMYWSAHFISSGTQQYRDLADWPVEIETRKPQNGRDASS